MQRAIAPPPFFFAPDLIGPGLLPCCDSITTVRLLAACSALRACGHLVSSFEAVFSRAELLDDDGVRGLARSLRFLTQLRSVQLSLPYQKLGPVDAGERLAESVGRLRWLMFLTVDLRHNALGNAGLVAWARALGELKQLKVASLGFGLNEVGVVGVEALSTALCAASAASPAQQLEDLMLKLDANPIGNGGATSILSAAVRLPSLRQLRVYIADCHIDDSGATDLANVLAVDLSNRVGEPLTYICLDLSGNGSCGSRSFGSGAERKLSEVAKRIGRDKKRCCCMIKV